MTLLFILNIAACIAGIGGSEFNIPIALICFGLGKAKTVPFNLLIVTGVTFYRYIIQILHNIRHPKINRSIINYDLAAMMVPCIFIGTTFGVFVNMMLPELFWLLLYICILVFAFIKALQKYELL